MGNRAVIILESMPAIGIYLHWNGGPESVLAFLEATRLRGARSPKSDDTYCLARLTQTIGEFMSQDGDYQHSLGIGPVGQLDMDNMDNGTYYVGDAWEITRREFTDDTHLTVDSLGEKRRVQYDNMLECIAGLTKKRDAA